MIFLLCLDTKSWAFVLSALVIFFFFWSSLLCSQGSNSAARSSTETIHFLITARRSQLHFLLSIRWNLNKIAYGFVPLYLFDLNKPFILSLVPEAQGCRRCPELIRSQIAAGLSPSCAPSSAIILVLIPTVCLRAYHIYIFFFFHLNFHLRRFPLIA